MDIKIGSPVVGTHGKLGHVRGLIFDGRTNRVDELVVHSGLVLGQDHVVPMTRVARVEGDTVYLDLDTAAFNASERYTDQAFHGRDVHYTAPPAAGHQTAEPGGFLADEIAASGGTTGTGFFGGKPLGYPGGEQVVPDDEQPPAIFEGMDVCDVNGDKAGTLSAFSVDATTGAPSSIRIRRGALPGHSIAIPAEWVQTVSREGLLLTVPKEQVETHAKS